MAAFLVCLIACLMAGIGSRTQYLAAALATRFAGLASLAAAALIAAILAGSAAAWAGQQLAGSMNGNARLMLVGLALLMAGGSMLLAVKPPRVGSGRLGAFATALLLLLPYCLLDGAAFIVTAATAYWRFPMLAAIGGAAGMFAGIMAGLLLGPGLARLPLRIIAFIVGSLFALIGGFLVVKAIG